MKIAEVEISPCIVAKAKWALGLTEKKPINKKTCSQEYWNGIIDHLANLHNLDTKLKDQVKAMTSLFRQK